MKIDYQPIRDGIEWFKITRDDGGTEEDCQCARCGSSCEFVRCGNFGCDHGYIEDEDDPEFGVRICDWCGGSGGSWRCLSTPEHCKANPLPNREGIESTALNAEAWRDTL